MARRKLLFRADANAEMGTGHVMRCLALAQGWQEEGGCALFFSAISSKSLLTRLEQEGVEVKPHNTQPGTSTDLTETIRTAQASGSEWVVLDGYFFDENFQKGLKAAGLKALLIADYAQAKHFFADLILNQNLHAHEKLYQNRESHTQLLLGSQFALLRKEFTKRPQLKHQISKTPEKFLVTFGGSDPGNWTSEVIKALKQYPQKTKVILIAGPANARFEELKKEAEKVPEFQILSNVQEEMPDLMADVDLAIAASGSTCWEMSFMGLPAIVVPVAENQQPLADELGKREVVSVLSDKQNFSKDLSVVLKKLQSASVREAMSAKAQKLVDGQGVARTLMHLSNRRIRLQKVQASDCRQVFEWSNLPDVRQASFTTEPLKWDKHVSWFEDKLKDPRCFFFLALNQKDQPVGQIRCVLEDNHLVLSLSLAPEFRGKGYGTEMIQLATAKVFAATRVKSARAFIKKENSASLGVFLKAGFQKTRTLQIQGADAIELSFENQ